MEKQQKGTNSGFLFGVLVGVVITLLLVTKKGRKILKMLLDESKDKIAGWDGLIKEFEGIIDETEGSSITDDFVPDLETNTEAIPTNNGVVQPVSENVINTADKHSVAPARRRLFRGIRKRS